MKKFMGAMTVNPSGRPGRSTLIVKDLMKLMTMGIWSVMDERQMSFVIGVRAVTG